MASTLAQYTSVTDRQTDRHVLTRPKCDTLKINTKYSACYIFRVEATYC